MKMANLNRLFAIAMLVTGTASLLAAVFYYSSVASIIGLGLTFWGAILLYITPSKHVMLDMLNAAASSTNVNIEKLLTDFNPKGKGMHLPPKYLKDYESSLVFIPQKSKQKLPTPEEIDQEKLYSKNPEGLLLVPVGLALSKLFEKKLATSFTKTDLNFIQEKLPKLLIEDTEIAENAKVETQDNMITIEVTKSIFADLCRETRKLQKTHEQIGCLLSSAIACALAKATGKPIVIEKEEQSPDEKTARIQYQILEE